jgi:hypothetical protein
MRYRDLVEDGHIPGLLVHPDWWEPKHPQETPPDMTDPIALRRPAPEISIETDYGNPEAPTPIPADPVLSDPNTTIAVSMTAGDTQVVLDEALTYIIGKYVFIALDGGGYFVSRIVSTADSPHLTVPFATPFSGTATAGNQVYISEGFFPLEIVQQNYDITIGNYLNGSFFTVGYKYDPPPDPNPHTSSVVQVDETGRVQTVGDNGIPVHLDTVSQNSGFNFLFNWYEHPSYPGGELRFDTYSFIEIDHKGGTVVLDTRDLLAGGDMDHSASRDSDYGGFNPDGLIQFVFPWQSEGRSVIWEGTDDGQTHQVRLIP